jgi:hypothetical protein
MLARGSPNGCLRQWHILVVLSLISVSLFYYQINYRSSSPLPSYHDATAVSKPVIRSEHVRLLQVDLMQHD